MREIETDYLVVGAGASGMAFTDALIAASDADVVLVDRRHRPGGHWLDAYPFVRLHQPSAYFGVTSRTLGHDRIDTAGPNAGFYERATAAEICDYFDTVLEQDLIPSGQVRFFGLSDYEGEDGDGHHVVSLLTGERTRIRVRRALVDGTYTESSIPSRHTPGYEIADGARVIAPNDLVDLQEAASGFTILGAGKTAMDTCTWLMDQGIAPDAIRWVRPRDGYVMDRRFFQPLEQVGSYMEMQGLWVEAAAEAEDSRDFARRLEGVEVFARIDPTVEPDVYRGATLSAAELANLRQIENVVRMGRARKVDTDRVVLDGGEIATDTRHVHVDCTAEGVRPTTPRPVFEPGRITLQYVTIGIVPYGAATIGAIEARRSDDVEKNRLTPVLTFTGRVDDLCSLSYAGMQGIGVRGAEPDLVAWNEACRLNPARGAGEHLDDPRVTDGFNRMGTHFFAAMENLERSLQRSA